MEINLAQLFGNLKIYVSGKSGCVAKYIVPVPQILQHRIFLIHQLISTIAEDVQFYRKTIHFTSRSLSL